MGGDEQDCGPARCGAAETVRQWVRKVPIEGSGGTVELRAGAEVIRKLGPKNAELKRVNGIPKAASAFFAAGIDRPHR